MTFGLGRGVDYQDMPTVRRIVRESADDNFQFSSLVLGIINSEQFRMKHKPDNEILVADTANGQVD